MSASSSAASSTLTRSRLAVFGFASVATAITAYWFYRSLVEEEENAQVSGLHRSNAVRRRRTGSVMNEIGAEVADLGRVMHDDGVVDMQSNMASGSNMVPLALNDGETVVDDQAFADEYGWTNMPQTYQRNGQNIVQLLFRVSEDATRRNAYVHRGCACNSCNMLPIRGIRYRCANCADYDLCEGCESQGLHIKTHIFYKIKVPAPSFGPRHIQPVWYSGDPDNAMRVLSKETTTKLSRETGFERPELDAYWEQWTFMANTDWRDDPDDINLAMDRRTFDRCLVPTGGSRHSAPSLIFDRMFAFYDTNKDDLIGFPEFLHGVSYRKKKDKWRKIFEGYDIDGDGYVDRKDFLRMFRSYYVLHRQIHRDMIEGAEEQQMSSTEAHRLISGRQPLSSAFGQDGRYPRAPDPRTGEGKGARTYGDLHIIDGKGIMNESGNDTGNREDIFRRDARPTYGNSWHGDLDRYNTTYWETIVDPPQTLGELPAVLQNLQRVRGQVAEVLSGAPFESSIVVRQDDEDSISDSALSNPAADRNWPPSYVRVTDEDAEAIDGPGTTVENVRKESRQAVIAQATYREEAQENIRNRWQRRRFYTDEEEGATPPADWNEEDDILAQSSKAGESSKAQSRPIIHSRSSSRVRFAEDMDDFDTQSNVSTSSRSVPERWGGMEIPDAERDAGKEILYQVTQQAFNELLDPLFKEKEDLAMEAASTKPEREKWNSLFMNPRFEQWALKKEAEENKPKKVNITRYPANGPLPATASLWPAFSEVEVEQVRERPLEELLAATGYEVDASLAQQNDEDNEGEEISDYESNHGTTRPTAVIREQLPREDSDLEELAYSPAFYAPETSSTAGLLAGANGQEHGMRIDSAQHTSPEFSTPYRDPTLPQFRPDTVEFPYRPTSSHLTADALHILQEEVRNQPIYDDHHDKSATAPPAPLPYKPNFEHNRPMPRPPRQPRLYELWKIERAEKKAESEGGFGRLGFEEFEKKVKAAVGEGRGSQMDYLGSWIEFCIP